MHLSPSRAELGCLVFCHLLAVSAIWHSGWSLPVCLALTLVTAGNGWYQLRQGLKLLNSSILGIQLGHAGQVTLLRRQDTVNARVCGIPMLNHWAMLLDFEICPQQQPTIPGSWLSSRRVRLLIAADAVPKLQRKALVRWLREQQL